MGYRKFAFDCDGAVKRNAPKVNAPENPPPEDFRERSRDFGGSTPPKSHPQAIAECGFTVRAGEKRVIAERRAITERRFTERAEANCRKIKLYPRKFRGIFYIFKKSIDKNKKACYTVINVYIQFTGEDYEYHFKQQFKRADLCAD